MPIEPRLTVQSNLGQRCNITVSSYGANHVEVSQCGTHVLMDRETAFELIRAIKAYFEIKDANGKED